MIRSDSKSVARAINCLQRGNQVKGKQNHMKRDSNKNISSRGFAYKGGWEYNIDTTGCLSSRNGRNHSFSHSSPFGQKPIPLMMWPKLSSGEKEAKNGPREAVKATWDSNEGGVVRPITRLLCRPGLRRHWRAKSKERGRTIADVRRKQE